MKAAALQNAELSWTDDGIPVSSVFDDPYFSRAGGLDEGRHVFLAGNALPARFCPGFRIAELGFGTALNALIAAQAWQASGQTGRLHYTAFEAFPMAAPDMSRALSAWPELAPLAAPLVAQYAAGATHIQTPVLDLHLVLGDARITVPHWSGQADAWFLDGFSPAKNPELWEQALLNAVAQHTAPRGSCATYTAAGFVRRALAQAGFIVIRQTGFGRKKHMTTARLETEIAP